MPERSGISSTLHHVHTWRGAVGHGNSQQLVGRLIDLLYMAVVRIGRLGNTVFDFERKGKDRSGHPGKPLQCDVDSSSCGVQKNMPLSNVGVVRYNPDRIVFIICKQSNTEERRCNMSEEQRKVDTIPVMIDHADYMEIMNSDKNGRGCIAVPDKIREGDRILCIDSEKSPTSKSKRFTGNVTVCRIKKLLKHPHIAPGYALVEEWIRSDIEPKKMDPDYLQDIMDNYRKGNAFSLTFKTSKKKAEDNPQKADQPSTQADQIEIRTSTETPPESNKIINGFSIIKQSYQTMLNQGKISEAEAKKKIRVYEFLENCDRDDFCIISDSSALNDIIKSYCKIAIEQGNVKGILDTYPAKEVLKRYYGESEAEMEQKEKSKSKSI